MAIQEYVYLADARFQGHRHDAGRPSPRLYRSGRDTAERAGREAIDSIVLEKFAAHFDQLALRDCVHVIALAQEWLKQPSRIEVVISMEHQSLQNMLTGWKDDPERLRAIVKVMQPKTRRLPIPIWPHRAERLVNSSGPSIPPCWRRLAPSLKRRIGRWLLLEMRKPVWERKPLRKLETRATMATRLYVCEAPHNSQALAASIPKPLVSTCSASTRDIRRFAGRTTACPPALELNLPCSPSTLSPAARSPTKWPATSTS